MFAFEQRGTSKKNLTSSMNYNGNYSGGAIQRKTTIKYWPGYYKYMDGESEKSVLVGRKMEAELDPDDPKQGSTAGSSRDHAELMAHLKLVYPTSKVRGHLLNDHLGGMGIDVNFFPISSEANKAHLNKVEKHVKHLVYKTQGNRGTFTRYQVEVRNEDGFQDFNEECPRTSFECTVINGGRIYRQQVCSDISNNKAEVTGDSMDNIGISNNNSKAWDATKTLAGFERGEESEGRYLLLRKNGKEETEVGTVYMPGKEEIQSITEEVLADEGTGKAIRETLMEAGMDLEDEVATLKLRSRIPALQKVSEDVALSVCKGLYSIEGRDVKREILEWFYSEIGYEEMKDRVEEQFLVGETYEFVKQDFCRYLEERYTGQKNGSDLMQIEVLGSELIWQIECELEKESEEKMIDLCESDRMIGNLEHFILQMNTTVEVADRKIKDFFYVIIEHIYEKTEISTQNNEFLDNVFSEFREFIRIKIIEEIKPIVKRKIDTYSYEEVLNFVREYGISTKCREKAKQFFGQFGTNLLYTALGIFQEEILHKYVDAFIYKHFLNYEKAPDPCFENFSPDVDSSPSYERIIDVILCHIEGIQDGDLISILRYEIYKKMQDKALAEADENEEDDEDYNPVELDEDFLN